MKQIIYDCDPGIDDALAMILALKSKKVDLQAVTTVHGNSSLENTTNNASRVLEFFNAEVSVGKGAKKPLNPHKMSEEDEKRKISVHGLDGMGDSILLKKRAYTYPSNNAVDLILEKIKNGVRTIVATGPLTNIAQAFIKDPQTMSQLEELIIMGGVFLKPGNITRVSEVNFYLDPHAAQYIIQKSVNKIIVPLNITHQVILTREAVDKMPSTRTGNFIKSIVRNYQDFYMRNTDLSGCPLHDPLAMGYAIDPDILTLKELNIQIETKGKFTMGMCVPELRHKYIPETKPNAKVAHTVKAKQFIDYFLSTVINGEV